MKQARSSEWSRPGALAFVDAVALGLIEIDADKSPIFADVRGRKIALTPHKLPFIPHNYKR